MSYPSKPLSQLDHTELPNEHKSIEHPYDFFYRHYNAERDKYLHSKNFGSVPEQKKEVYQVSPSDDFGFCYGLALLIGICIVGLGGWLFYKRSKMRQSDQPLSTFDENDRKALELMNSLGNVIKKT